MAETNRWREVLGSPACVAMIGVVAVLLALPSLGAGWLVDDYWHQLALTDRQDAFDVGVIKSDSVWDLFSFLDGDAKRNRKLMDLGVVPWWTYEGLKGSFCRPVTALTHVLDYRLWPQRAWLMHLHSVMWYALLAALLTVFYRRMLGPTWVAGLAGLLYAMNDVHGTPVGFLANRNALVAGVFGVLTLLAHDRWRRQRWPTGAILAPILFLIALFAKEAAVAVGGYLLAYALIMDRSPRQRALATLLPYACVVIGWRIVWSAMGYGITTGTELYVDPGVEPLRYAWEVAQRVPVLLMGQWGISADLAFVVRTFAYRWLFVVWCIAVAFIALLAITVVPRVWHDKAARFFLTGMLLAALPACTAFPSDRLLVFVGIGAAPVLACFFAVMLDERRSPKTRSPGAPTDRRRLVGGLPVSLIAGLLVLRHVALAPVAMAFRSGNPIGPTAWTNQFHVHTPFDAAVAEQTVVIVSAPVVMLAGQLAPLRVLNDLPAPKHTRILSPSGVAVTLTRTDRYTLVVRPVGGYLRWFFDEIFRSKAHPMILHQRVELSDVTVTVTELTEDGRPAEAAFRFEVPLEDASLLWLRWDDPQRKFLPFEVPVVGQQVIEAPIGITGML